jgi:hypothetical protein
MELLVTLNCSTPANDASDDLLDVHAGHAARGRVALATTI